MSNIKPIDEVRNALNQMSPQFKAALPAHVTPEKFIRTLMTSIQNNPRLIEANRQSLYSAAIKCAADGLIPDSREASLVPYGGQVQYLPMTAGILKKVRNSGELLSISPHVVYSNDSFDYWIDEKGEHLKHKPNLSGNRGDMTHAYAIALTKDGGVYIEVMSRDEIEQVRQMSKQKDSGPWRDWPGEQWKKTVIRRLSKRLPMSTDLIGVDLEVQENFEPVSPVTEPPPSEPDEKEVTPKKKTPSRTKELLKDASAANSWAMTDAQRKRLFAIAKGNEWNDLAIKGAIKELVQKESTSDLTKDEYEFVCDFFEKEKPRGLDEVPNEAPL